MPKVLRHAFRRSCERGNLRPDFPTFRAKPLNALLPILVSVQYLLQILIERKNGCSTGAVRNIQARSRHRPNPRESPWTRPHSIVFLVNSKALISTFLRRGGRSWARSFARSITVSAARSINASRAGTRGARSTGVNSTRGLRALRCNARAFKHSRGKAVMMVGRAE